MPTYEYHCNACAEDLEVFQSMKDAPLSICPSCGKRGKIHRRISGGAGIIFKGSGFYETDYKAKSAPKEDGGASKSGESPKDAGGKDAPKKETAKPAAKAES